MVQVVYQLTITDKKYTDREFWTYTNRSIVKALHVAIEAHESANKEWIHVDWLKDYADDISFNFPKETPKELK